MGMIQKRLASLQMLLINFYQDNSRPSRFRQSLCRRCNFKGDYQLNKAGVKNILEINTDHRMICA